MDKLLSWEDVYFGGKMLVDGRYVIFWTRQNPPSMTQIFKFHKLNTINNFYFFIILYDSISYASQMDIYQEIKKIWTSTALHTHFSIFS